MTGPAVIPGAQMGIRPDDPARTLPGTSPFRPDLNAPQKDWFFEKPEWMDDHTKIWVDSDGRAAGWYYHADSTCLIGSNEEECWRPQPSPTGNEVFHQNAVVTDEGDVVQVGVIGGSGEHAPTWMDVQQASAYYADVDKQKLIGRLYDVPGKGGYFLGAVLPKTSCADVSLVRRSATSGDWRWRKFDNSGNPLNQYDALGPWLVTRPGLPLHRAGYQLPVAAAAAGEEHPPITYIAAGRGSNQYKKKGTSRGDAKGTGKKTKKSLYDKDTTRVKAAGKKGKKGGVRTRLARKRLERAGMNVQLTKAFFGNKVSKREVHGLARKQRNKQLAILGITTGILLGIPALSGITSASGARAASAPPRQRASENLFGAPGAKRDPRVDLLRKKAASSTFPHERDAFNRKADQLSKRGKR